MNDQVNLWSADCMSCWAVSGIAVAVVNLFLLSCSMRCDSQQQLNEPMITIGRLSGGTAPELNILRVYSTGKIELEYSGGPVYCGTATPQTISGIAALIETDFFQNAVSSPSAGFDLEEAQIETGDITFRVVIEERPCELTSLFALVDKIFSIFFWLTRYFLFSSEFDKRYDLPLMRPAWPSTTYNGDPCLKGDPSSSIDEE